MTPDKDKGYHHGDLRNALLRAAGELLAAEAPEALSLRGVARAAGVSPAAPYHHFASKEELLAALATQGFLEIEAEMRAHAGPADDPVGRLVGIGVGYVLWAHGHPGVYKIMHGQGRYVAGTSPELAEAGRRAYGVLVEAVAGVAPGADAARGGAIRAAAWSIVHGLAMHIADRALEPPPGATLEAFVRDVLSRGVAGMAGCGGGDSA